MVTPGSSVPHRTPQARRAATKPQVAGVTPEDGEPQCDARLLLKKGKHALTCDDADTSTPTDHRHKPSGFGGHTPLTTTVTVHS